MSVTNQSALTKEIQWRCPEKFGNDEYFSLLGALHIEHSLLGVHGQLIKGTGLEDILEENNISIIGTSAVVDASHIKRARYCVQLCACAIYNLMKESHKTSGSDLPLLEWIDKKASESQMCFLMETTS